MRNEIIFKLGLALLVAISLCAPAFALTVKSDAFENNGYIPDRYSCDAQDFSPAISWGEVPSGTKSFALICEDPDAPFKIWTHWVIFNIPADLTSLKENITVAELKKLGVVQGKNDFGTLGYKGPCPPEGKPHRYFFNLYALDTTLSLEEGIDKAQLIAAMQGHIIAESKTTASYQRQ